MTTKVLLGIALAVLILGVTLAVFVVPVRTCGMDEFDCYPNVDKMALGVGAGVLSLGFGVAASFSWLGERGARGSRG